MRFRTSEHPMFRHEKSPRVAVSALILLGASLSACGGESKSQAVYLSDTNRDYAEKQTEGFDEESGSFSPDGLRFKASVCRDFDLTPETKELGHQDLARFLGQRGYEVKTHRAREDLVYMEVTRKGQQPIRLRVAILEDSVTAGRSLHEAILEHGPGAWGVHRGNIAVLAPIGSTQKIVYFAALSKLACWGELMLAGRDDAFAIPGGYREL